MHIVQLRAVSGDDLPIFFEQMRDPTANHMAAFTAKDPDDRHAFDLHWAKILADPTLTIQTILFGGQVAGHIACHGWFGDPEISYWLGKEFWGQGIATRALAAFMELVETRPLYARAANDNTASLRVLEKCGFTITGEDQGFSTVRGQMVKELILILR